MEIGLRLLALVIDLAVCFATLPVVLGIIGWFFEHAGILGLPFLPLSIAFLILWPALCMGIPTGIWGRSLGKLICRLSVEDEYGRPPGVWRALGREVLKCLALGFGIGALITLFQVLYQGGTWYDQLCRTRVAFSPYVRLTKTQRNWRKQMRK